MNSWRKVQTGLVSVALSSAVGVVAAQAAPDSWHGGGNDVIVLESVGGDPDYIGSDAPGERGTLPTGVGWAHVFGYELRGRTAPYEYAAITDSGAHWCTGSERFADARVDVPHNVYITHLRLWAYDNAAGHDVAAILFRSCLPTVDPGDPQNTILGMVSSSGSPGDFTNYVNISAEPTNTNLCSYFIRARFGTGCGGGGETTFRRARIQYSTSP